MKNNYLLEQADNFLITTKIKELIQKRGFSSAIIHSYDLEEVPLSAALEDLDTYGFFSEQKVVIISHIDMLSSDSTDLDVQHFLHYLKNPLDSVLLFVTAKKLNNTKKLTKELKKEAEIVSFDYNAMDYVKKELEGYRLENGVVRKLVTDCLEDIGRLHQECDKLKLYRMDTKSISISDVEELVVKKIGDSKDLTFDFVRVLASKDKKDALKKFQQLQQYSIEALSLIGLLASQFLIMYQVKLLEKRTHLNQEIADVLGEKPYRIQKTRELTRYYSEQELRDILRNLADMDLKIKTTAVDGNFLVELFILENT